MQLGDPERYLRPSGRPREFTVGIVVGSLSTLFLGLAAYVIGWALLHDFLEPPIVDKGKLGFMLVPAVLLALGIPGAWVAFRLVTGRRRRDGGLFSPGMLRLCGTLMMVGPWLWVILDLTDYWRWGHLVSFTTAGIACWILAARRERRDAADPTISVPNNEPLN